MTTIRYRLGLDLAFAEPTAECRDELLFHIIDRLVRFTDAYQLREIVAGNAILECPCEDVDGDRVITAGDDGRGPIGGPLSTEESAAIIADVDRGARAGTLSTAPLPALFAGPWHGAQRVVLLPPYCAVQLLEFPATHPLRGTAAFPAAEMRALCEPLLVLDEAAKLAAVLDVALRHRLVMSARVE